MKILNLEKCKIEKNNGLKNELPLIVKYFIILKY